MRCLHWHRWLWQGCLTPLLRARSEAGAREWQLGSRQIDNSKSQRWQMSSEVRWFKDFCITKTCKGTGWRMALDDMIFWQSDFAAWHEVTCFTWVWAEEAVWLCRTCSVFSILNYLVCPVYYHKFWVIDIWQSLQAKWSTVGFSKHRIYSIAFFFVKASLVP